MKESQLSTKTGNSGMRMALLPPPLRNVTMSVLCCLQCRTTSFGRIKQLPRCKVCMAAIFAISAHVRLVCPYITPIVRSIQSQRNYAI